MWDAFIWLFSILTPFWGTTECGPPPRNSDTWIRMIYRNALQRHSWLGITDIRFRESMNYDPTNRVEGKRIIVIIPMVWPLFYPRPIYTTNARVHSTDVIYERFFLLKSKTRTSPSMRPAQPGTWPTPYCRYTAHPTRPRAYCLVDTNTVCEYELAFPSLSRIWNATRFIHVLNGWDKAEQSEA